VIWFFRPGTEERVEVLELTQGPTGPLAPADVRWGILCQACGVYFTLPPDYGVRVGADGAITTTQSLNCPQCLSWHVRFSGGVVEHLG